MKGTTHAAIGLAAAGVIINTPINNPNTWFALAAAYTGALMCDIDTGNSTISNGLSILKSHQVRNILTSIYIMLGVVAVYYFYNTQYLIPIMVSLLVGGLLISQYQSKIYYYVKKGMLITTAILFIVFGIMQKQYPLISIGAVFGVMIFSPHRGYSHSLLYVVCSFLAVRYACIWYNLPNISLYFAIGMLSHIIADMFTNQGVMVLFPYPKKIHFPWTITTGSKVEYILSAIALSVLAMSLI